MQPRGEYARVDEDPGLVFSTDPPSAPVDLVLDKRHQRDIPSSAMLKAKFELFVITPLTFSGLQLDDTRLGRQQMGNLVKKRISRVRAPSGGRPTRISLPTALRNRE
jgi:hypothetical protein